MTHTDGDNASKKIEIFLPINIIDILSLSPIQDKGFFIIGGHTGH
jgi:hypothetical protein